MSKRIADFMIFADIFDDDYELMAAALQELGGHTRVETDHGFFDGYQYLSTMSDILDMPMKKVSDWKKCYSVRVGRLM